MAQPLKTQLGLHRDTLRIIADGRLTDFQALWKANRWHTAIYIGGYALEEYLKCAICFSLDSQQLPVIFEYHDLRGLLFYSGFENKLLKDKQVHSSFSSIAGIWKV